MNHDNFKALAHVIRLTQRFDMGVIVGRYDPEADEVLVEPDTPCPREFWTDPTLVGDFCAWVNALSEHEPIDNEDAAAAWLDITIDQLDRLSYTDGTSVWAGRSYDEITAEMAADMLDRVLLGEVVL